MGLRSINFNADTLSSLRQAKRSQVESAHAQAQLKTGRRILTAKDDSSGAAIATRLRSRAQAGTEGLRNMNEAIAALGIAEAALDAITQSVNQLKALGVRASTGLKVTADIILINQENKKILSSIRKSIDAAEYNGRKLLTGGLSGAVGVAVNYGIGSVNIALSRAKLSALGISNLSFMGAGNARLNAAQLAAQVTLVNIALDRLSGMKGRLGALQSQVDSLVASTEGNVDKTEEARSAVEDIDALEAQTNAVTAHSKDEQTLRAFMLALQSSYRAAQTTMDTMQMMISA